MRLQLLVCSRSASGKKCDFALQFHDVSIGWNLLVESVKRQLIQILHLRREDSFAFYYIDDEDDAVTVRDSIAVDPGLTGGAPQSVTDQQRLGMARSASRERRRANGSSCHASGSSFEGEVE